MSNEIKVGDKVRVREDVPRVYLRRCDKAVEYVVYAVDGDAAAITHGYREIAIPLKYLIKVDAEAKEAKYHKGDRVKFKNIYELQKVKDKSFRWMLVMFASKEATITAVEDNGFYRVDIDPSIGGINDDMIECKVEPTEHTEAEKNDADNLKKVAEEWANTVSDAIKEYGDAACEIITEARTEAYWDAYTDELAKEVALKVANKFNGPKEAAEYAVKVAKAVVEGLKRK